MRTGRWLTGNFRILVISCTVSSLLWLTALVFCRMGTANGEALRSAWMVRGFSQPDVQAALRLAGDGDEFAYVDGKRTSDFDGLIICGETGTNSRPVAWIVRSGTVRRVDRHPGHSYVDENGNSVVWWDAAGLHFPDRPTVKLPTDVYWVDVDVKGRFLSLTGKNGSTSVRRVEWPNKEEWGCTNFHTQTIKVVGNRVFLFGNEPSPRTNPGCIVLVRVGESLTVERRIDLDFGDVMDVDPTGEALLNRERFEVFGRIYLYNIKSRKMSKCRTAGLDYPAFLRTDLFARPLVAASDGKAKTITGSQ